MRLDPGPSDWLKLAALVIGVPMRARGTDVTARAPDWAARTAP